MVKKRNKLAENLKKGWDYFRKRSISVKILLVVAVLFLVFYTLLIGIAWASTGFLSIKIFITNFINPLGLDLKTPFSMTILFWICIAPILLIIYPFAKRKVNWYLVLTIYLLIFLVVFGVSITNQSYPYDLPRSYTWTFANQSFSQEFSCAISFLECKSATNKNNFVVNDQVICNFSFGTACNYKFDNFKTYKAYLNSTDTSIDYPYNNMGTVVFDITDNLRFVQVSPYFSVNNSESENIYSIITLFDKYSDSDYNQRKQNKAVLLITIISAILFSTIIAMNNLRQLMEKRSVRSSKNSK